MTAATHIIWRLAGSPAPAIPLRDTPDMCTVCGQQAEQTAPATKVLGGNFTDRSLYRAHTPSVCAACSWCILGRPPASLRMWTIIATPGRPSPAPSHEKAWLQHTPGLCLTNRANPQPVVDILTAPPSSQWVVSVAYSGQKHVAPYANINRGSGPWTIRVEDHYVTSTPSEFRQVRAHALALRRLGVPADLIRAGQPHLLKTRDELDTWRHHSSHLHPYLGSPLLDLTLWTITKGNM